MKRFLRGFVDAGRGLWTCLREERNFRIHLCAAAYALGFAPAMALSRGEWAALLLTIALVIGMEAVNTAIERAVDLASPDRHPLARAAKDAAAGAVLFCAVAAVGVGVALFGKPVAWIALWGRLIASPWKLSLLVLSLPAAFGLIVLGGCGQRKEP